MKIPNALKTPQIVLSIFACLTMSCTVYKGIPTASLAENLANVPNSIRAGDVISITLENETIPNLKVTAADSGKIAGAQSVITKGNRTIQTRIVSRSEIVRIQKPSHPYQVIMPDDMLRMTLKNGEHVNHFKVKGVNSGTIEGVDTHRKNESGTPIQLRQIEVSDVENIWKKTYSGGATIAFIFVAPLVATFIYEIGAIIIDPCHTLGAGCK